MCTDLNRGLTVIYQISGRDPSHRSIAEGIDQGVDLTEGGPVPLDDKKNELEADEKDEAAQMWSDAVRDLKIDNKRRQTRQREEKEDEQKFDVSDLCCLCPCFCCCFCLCRRPKRTQKPN